jgi:hypothetical protein
MYSQSTLKKERRTKMKVVVRLAILVATLLLVSTVAFAQCMTDDHDRCYAVTLTDEYGNTYTDTWYVYLCDEGWGSLYSDNANDDYDLFLFGGGPGWFNTAGNPMFGGVPLFTSWIADDAGGHAGYIQPQGPTQSLITGEGHDGSTRYTFKGMRVPLTNCPR